MHQELMHVLLASQDAEIIRIVVWSQPGEVVCVTISWKKKSQKGGGVTQV
jgi:hypothetical protein